jgi:hypothetical protein
LKSGRNGFFLTGRGIGVTDAGTPDLEQNSAIQRPAL